MSSLKNKIFILMVLLFYCTTRTYSSGMLDGPEYISDLDIIVKFISVHFFLGLALSLIIYIFWNRMKKKSLRNRKVYFILVIALFSCLAYYIGFSISMDVVRGIMIIALICIMVNKSKNVCR
jgi:amino acid transporter